MDVKGKLYTVKFAQVVVNKKTIFPKRMYGIELMIIIVMTFASAFSASTVSGLSVFFILGMWRVFLGFGIGGDYPLSG